MKPLVSIVITTKNEEENIEHCLISIKGQTYPASSIETIVVDNKSSDNTKEIARKFTKKIYDLGPERSAQRNYGILQKARGKYVMYLDADMVLSPTVIERAIEEFEKNQVIALYVPEIVLGNSYWSKVRRFERSFYDGTVIDCVRFLRKDAFEEVGGFDVVMTGPEDWDLDKKIRKKGKVAVLNTYDFDNVNAKVEAIDFREAGWFDKLVKMSDLGLIYHNESEFDLSKYLSKKTYYSQSFKAYIDKWGKSDPDIRMQFGFYYRYFGVFLKSAKWDKFFKYFNLLLGMYLLRLLVGFNYLFKR
ncbi:MAG: glycosyltransferase [Patescibacteria group bacterium]